MKGFVNKRDLPPRVVAAIERFGLARGYVYVMLLQNVLAPFISRHRYRRLVEFDVSRLIQIYGNGAAARALEFDARGDAFLEGRRKGHWRRVARCIAGRPDSVRPSPVFS